MKINCFIVRLMPIFVDEAHVFGCEVVFFTDKQEQGFNENTILH